MRQAINFRHDDMQTAIFNALKNAGGSSARLLERASLSALYILINCVVIFHYPDFEHLKTPSGYLLLGGYLILSYIVASLAYEVIVPFHRAISRHWVMRGFGEIVEIKGKAKAVDYEYFRRWKYDFLASRSPAHLKQNFEREMSRRRQHTYLFASSVVVFIAVSIYSMAQPASRHVSLGLLGFSVFVMMGTSFGHRQRSIEVGRAFAHGYTSQIKVTKQQRGKNVKKSGNADDKTSA